MWPSFVCRQFARLDRRRSLIPAKSGLRIPSKRCFSTIISHSLHSVLSLIRNLYERCSRCRGECISFPESWLCRVRRLSCGDSSRLAIRMMYCIHAKQEAYDGLSRLFYMVPVGSRAVHANPFNRSLMSSTALSIRYILLLDFYALSRLFSIMGAA
ncbi:hypothetical protein BDU57DRAFT_515597 [Ampelomyces quisqualis]|uniref:Uncharacterized protein n=1 Tax=Ampelomyces quisqualis TaxID=50730 RepID=A0A6A5QMC9_AMPQU|nr:hypothetical protein BDU57DRAFT_515597 [Ampelomyces quisqualis]